MRDAGFDTTTTTADVSSRKSVHALVERAAALGDVTGVIHAAGVSPSQAPPAAILAVDLYGTAVVLEEFANVIAHGGAGAVIASQSGHRLDALSPEHNAALASTPADELLRLPMLQPDQVTDTLHAYQLAKRANSLRVMAESVRWAQRGARINTISPGIVITPLARDELDGPRGESYRRMLELSPAGRAGTPDEIATLAALLMAPTAGSSPAATSSSTAESPPPTSMAHSPHSDNLHQPTPQDDRIRCRRRGPIGRHEDACPSTSTRSPGMRQSAGRDRPYLHCRRLPTAGPAGRSSQCPVEAGVGVSQACGTSRLCALSPFA